MLSFAFPHSFYSMHFPKIGESLNCRRAGAPSCSRNVFQVSLCTNRVSRAGCCCALTVAICDGKGQMDVVNKSWGGGGDHRVVVSWLFISLCPLHIV